METVRAEIRLVNHFSAPVEIAEVIKSCACAEASVTPTRLEPGQSASLKVTWRTGAKRGSVSDAVQVLAIVQMEPPIPAVASVRLTAEVQPDLLYDPAALHFVRDRAGTAELHFRPGRMSDARILSAHATSPGPSPDGEPADRHDHDRVRPVEILRRWGCCGRNGAVEQPERTVDDDTGYFFWAPVEGRRGW